MVKRPDTRDAEVARVNWKDLQLGKGTDVALQDGDFILVPKARTFFITGQVQHPGEFVLEPGTTVQQAIALAGGLTDRGSDRRVKATRIVKSKSVEVSLRLEDNVLPGDTITVVQRFFEPVASFVFILHVRHRRRRGLRKAAGRCVCADRRARFLALASWPRR